MWLFVGDMSCESFWKDFVDLSLTCWREERRGESWEREEERKEEQRREMKEYSGEEERTEGRKEERKKGRKEGRRELRRVGVSMWTLRRQSEDPQGSQ